MLCTQPSLSLASLYQGPAVGSLAKRWALNLDRSRRKACDPSVNGSESADTGPLELDGQGGFSIGSSRLARFLAWHVLGS